MMETGRKIKKMDEKLKNGSKHKNGISLKNSTATDKKAKPKPFWKSIYLDYFTPFPAQFLTSNAHGLNVCATFIRRILFILYVIVPVTVWLNPWIMKEIVFLRLIHYPFLLNFDDMDYFKLDAALNFRVNEKEVSLGTWHIPPKSLVPNLAKDRLAHEKSLSSGHPIVLYFHGNTGTRGGVFRLRLYRQLAAQDFHVITFDYSGFGDSPGQPTEQGMVEDGKLMLRWLKKFSKSSSIYIWGHSLGCGVATRMMKELSEEQPNDLPNALILEAPFNNVRDAAIGYPLSKLWLYYPFFEKLFIDPIFEYGLKFENDKNVVKVKVPVLIMHAVDDAVIPYDLGGKKLYDAVLKNRPSDFPLVEFRTFDEKDCRCGHYMFRSDNTMPVIRDFMKRVEAVNV
ncbi:lysophosphatidylserine lipase ABHD12-like [Tubulanus polymorphus]|uniref:lysophosphatidylserine lipase ABHD12-like n=1 Tax=Tubulanus polymorphus TaxID=672921 RepID=UPI003DA34ABC